MIVSFAWTAPAFSANRKSVTRRKWRRNYAEHFVPGTVHKAYSKQPRFGGRQIGLFRVISLTFEDIREMPDEDFEHEGFKYMEEQELMIWKKEPRVAFDEWRSTEDYYWVLRFEKISWRL